MFSKWQYDFGWETQYKKKCFVLFCVGSSLFPILMQGFSRNREALYHLILLFLQRNPLKYQALPKQPYSKAWPQGVERTGQTTVLRLHLNPATLNLCWDPYSTHFGRSFCGEKSSWFGFFKLSSRFSANAASFCELEGEGFQRIWKGLVFFRRFSFFIPFCFHSTLSFA